MSDIITILTNIGDLQATLSGNAIADENIMERLNEMRKTALAILNQGNETVHAAESYRKEALDKADALGVMLGLEDMATIPDSALFRMAAAADGFTSSVKTYMKMRNLLAAEQSFCERMVNRRNNEVS
ncbi:MAG TPA: hypothetical protein ENJ30_02040 [Desulfobulbaceae bacterium]|nr:hypothetical protein [Desulfobulbaceae bacterium]